jgi:hypothetical protein
VLLEMHDPIKNTPLPPRKIEILWRQQALKNKWTVKRLKEELYKRTGVHVADFSLDFHGVILEDKWTVEVTTLPLICLTGYAWEDLVNIQDDDTVTMRITGAGSKLGDLIPEEV